MINNEVGLTKDLLKQLILSFHSRTQPVKLQKALINLYSILVLDIDPLIDIQRSNFNTYIQSDLEKFSFSKETALVFFDTNSIDDCDMLIQIKEMTKSMMGQSQFQSTLKKENEAYEEIKHHVNDILNSELPNRHQESPSHKHTENHHRKHNFFEKI